MPKPDHTDAPASTKAAAESAPSPEAAAAESTAAAVDNAATTVDNAESAAPGNDTPPAADESPDETADETATAAAATVDTAAEPSLDELRSQLQSAQDENAALKDGLLRAKAEVENIRRRSQDEIVKTRKFAIENFAKELLEVKDNLDRAAAVELDDGASEAVRQMKEGLGLTLKQLDLAMARFAVVEVEAAPGVKFDPQRHQAVSTAPHADIAADHIVTVVQKGFALKERLLRPAMVVVAGG